MKKQGKLYFKLFSSTFYLSAFTLGGGFVIIPLMKKKFVDDLHWIEEQEMLNLAAIAQSAPGAVAVNASILVGYRIAGMIGAMVTILGTVLPPLIIISVISFFYDAFRSNLLVSVILMGMQAGVGAVILDVVFNLGGNLVKERDFVSILIMIGAFIANMVFKVNVVFIILVCGVLGGIKLQAHQHWIQKDGGYSNDSH